MKKLLLLLLLSISLVQYGYSQRKNPADIGVNYQLTLESGLLYDLTDQGGVANFDIINGIQFNNFISAGLGAGIRYETYEDSYYGTASLTWFPVFVDLRGNILRSKITPYWSFSAGYSFSGDFDGGAYVSEAVGASFRFSPKFALNVGVKNETQAINIFDSSWNSVGLVVGVSF